MGETKVVAGPSGSFCCQIATISGQTLLRRKTDETFTIRTGWEVCKISQKGNLHEEVLIGRCGGDGACVASLCA